MTFFDGLRFALAGVLFVLMVIAIGVTFIVLLPLVLVLLFCFI